MSTSCMISLSSRPAGRDWDSRPPTRGRRALDGSGGNATNASASVTRRTRSVPPQGEVEEKSHTRSCGVIELPIDGDGDEEVREERAQRRSPAHPIRNRSSPLLGLRHLCQQRHNPTIRRKEPVRDLEAPSFPTPLASSRGFAHQSLSGTGDYSTHVRSRCPLTFMGCRRFASGEPFHRSERSERRRQPYC